MGKGKERGIFKTKEIMTPKKAGIYLSLLYSWKTNQELTEVYEARREKRKIRKKAKKKETHSTILRYMKYFKEKGWINVKDKKIKFKNKKGEDAYKIVPHYRANIQSFLDHLITKSGTKYEKLKSGHIQSLLHLFFEFDRVRNDILHNSLENLEKEMDLNKTSEYDKNWEINFNEAVEGFKECIDNNLIFYIVYFGKCFNIPKEFIEEEKVIIKKYFGKTKSKIKKYLDEGYNLQFEKRVEIINQFEKDFENFEKSEERYDYQLKMNIANFIGKKSKGKGIEYETKLRFFVGCLYGAKTFVNLKEIFLGSTANRLIDLS